MPRETLRGRLLKRYPGGWTGFQRDRRAYLKEHPICEECGGALAEELDHVQPISRRPDLFGDKANWKGLCRPCHWKKTESERSETLPAGVRALKEYVKRM